ncbi:MAG: APC family permease [Symploca sp. SIO2E9]|nr:APC family permease [Symploca sp. SIO2E9]
MSTDKLISREEVLAGLPARRANTLLFLIESRTAHIAAQSRLEFSLTDSAAEERDLAFLEAFALGQTPPLRPTIQHLERYAYQWQSLVPENPRLKAALLHTLSQKYNFTSKAVPNIHAVLGLAQKDVQQTYRKLYHRGLSNAFTPRLSLTEQIRWGAAAIAQKLESLPPFWIASLITVSLGLPQAFLALPIAVAQVGPLATLALVVALGLINILTMACMAEAIGRSGDFRYGNAFIKQLAINYLGNTGSFILSLAVGIRVFLIALACYLGLSITMANFTSIPAPVWAALLFSAGLYMLSQKSLNFTVTVMVILAGVNISLLLFLSLLAFTHLQLDNLLYVNLPFLNGNSFEAGMLRQVFGVTLMLYFGHVYVGECAKLVLPRDASAKSLIWGSIAGTAFLTFLFCIWVLAVNGAIAPQVISTESGTVLEPLAQQIGPIVKILGAFLVTFLLGMAWIRSSSLLFNLGREWFPSRPQPVLIMPAKQGRLILQPRRNFSNCPSFGLTYLGLEGTQAKFDLDVQSGGKINHLEITLKESWEIQEVLVQLPSLNLRGIYLTLELHSANQERAQLKVSSSMTLTYEGNMEMLANASNNSRQRQSQTSRLAKLKPAKPSTLASWTKRVWALLLKEYRFLLSISPLVLVLVLTESLFLAGKQSFTNVLGFAGVLGNSLVGGIFPILLLVSSRRKGELVPGVVLKLLNHKFLLAGIYCLFFATLLLHGLLIWENPVARTSALSIAALSLGATLIMGHTGAFTPRTVLELREEQQEGGRTFFKITAGGQPKIAQVRLGYAEGEQCYQASTVEIPSLSSLHYASFELATRRIEELRVWAHREKTNGSSESLPALLEVHRRNKTMQFDLELSGGKVMLPLSMGKCYLKLYHFCS